MKMPKRKEHTRLDLIRELSGELTVVICKDKFEQLSYLDVIQALNINMCDSLRWLRRRQPYRKLKENK